jgi:hypothetical protein
MQKYSNIVEHLRAGWAEQWLIRQCRIDEPTARVVGELAGIQAACLSTDEIIARALARVAQVKRGTQ